MDLLVPQPDEAGVLRKQGEIIRHKTLVQMLTEQSILADIEQNRSDRRLDAFLAGLSPLPNAYLPTLSCKGLTDTNRTA